MWDLGARNGDHARAISRNESVDSGLLLCTLLLFQLVVHKATQAGAIANNQLLAWPGLVWSGLVCERTLVHGRPSWFAAERAVGCCDGAVRENLPFRVRPHASLIGVWGN